MKTRLLLLFVLLLLVSTAGLFLLGRRFAAESPTSPLHPLVDRGTAVPDRPASPLESAPDIPTVHEHPRAAVLSATPQAPIRPFTISSATPAELAEWQAKYESLAPVELEKAKVDFSLQLAEVCGPAYDEVYARGEYEVLGMSGQVSLKDWDDRPLCQIRCPPGDAPDQRVVKVTIREDEYPELYARQREYIWLRQRVRDSSGLASK